VNENKLKTNIKWCVYLRIICSPLVYYLYYCFLWQYYETINFVFFRLN